MPNPNLPADMNADETIQYRVLAHEDDWRAWKETLGANQPIYARLQELIQADTDGRPPQIDADVWTAWLETLTATQDPSAELARLLERSTERATGDDEIEEVNEKTLGVMAQRIAHRARTAKQELYSDDEIDEDAIEEQLEHIFKHCELLRG